MTPERWQNIKFVYEQVDSAPPGQRHDLLARLCHADVDLRRQVEQLFDSEDGEESGAFIQKAILEYIDEVPTPVTVQDRFGRYQIIKRIGQGGMGAVYEAVRVDDFLKKVAIKIIKQEFDSDFARARFQQERQFLAVLEHPYIARLIDGGESDSGSPYIVLEYVDGVPFSDYCEKLDRNARLRLFLKVCEAVEYAHRNLIIHRDLKPGNILVTEKGDPKLLDFGIAKLIDPSATLTKTSLMALTPEYASPEQVRGEPISTASDVYSLGVILYQILTGRKPYQLDSASPVEMDRVVCIEPPAAPGIGDELDHILMMALRKEPQRRYGSVLEFAQDIERYLSLRPVLARPDTTWYRTTKFIRRRWVVLAAATIALTGVLGGAGVAVYQARVADQRFQQVRKLANKFLFEFNDAIVDIPGTTKAQVLVVNTALEYLDSLSHDSNGDPALQAELAHAYQRVGAVQATVSNAALGGPAGGAINIRKALALWEPLQKRDPQFTSATAECWRAMAATQNILRQSRDAEDSARKGIELLHPERPDHTPDTLAQLAGLSEAQAIAARARSVDDSVLLIRRSTAYWDQWAKVAPPKDAAGMPYKLANAHYNLGNFLLNQSHLGEAATEMKIGLDYSHQALALNPESTKLKRLVGIMLIGLHDLYGAPDGMTLEQWNTALSYGREATDWNLKKLAADPNHMPSKLAAALSVLLYANDLSKAHPGSGLEEAAKGLALWRELKQNPNFTKTDERQVVIRLRNVVRVLSRAGRHREALKIAEEITLDQRHLLEGLPPTDDDNLFLMDDLWIEADEARAVGLPEKTAQRLAEAQRVAAPLIKEASEDTSVAFEIDRFYDALARDRAAAGACAEVRDWRGRQLALWRAVAGKTDYGATRLRQAETAVPSCGQ